MINKLYSILVAGSDPIPESWFAYRRYTVLGPPHSGVPTYSDPFRRSVWANYIIELSKLCPLYRYIVAQDPVNTYKNTRTVPDPVISVSGCSIVSIHNELPRVVMKAYISDQTVTGECNGLSFISTIDEGKFSTQDITVSIPEGTTECSVDFINPYVVGSLPSTRSVKSMMSVLPSDIRSALDLGKPQDIACAFCLCLLHDMQ